MKELLEYELEQIVGGSDEEPDYICGSWRDEDGSIQLQCFGPYGDDVLDNALDGCQDDGLPCFT